ncbi:ferrous iron transport protein B [Mycobacterium sp. Y57]|uniref:ferrous iron transport protein B n=1 Tax=Mycolicibacterium xanthum TaxID=2796469 RepID=UPI001C86461F|nr:ferrous iron transport protein B [Mycolicibacterium xanthum]MBX7435277.1 ferrous iron transport protein B [Mycolicibacterium xanthum]
MSAPACHSKPSTDAPEDQLRIALVGSPNSGKTSVFNHLTGMRARTGNYPGVTVARTIGTGKHTCPRCGTVKFTIEDLPGAYSLHPVSPDEKVVADLLQGELSGISAPDALAVVVDATVLERSLSLVAQVLALDKPTMVILTMPDELANRGGHIDTDRLATALGVPVAGVVGSRGKGFGPLRELMADPEGWSRVPIPPPRDDDEFNAWISSILNAARYRAPESDKRSAMIDRVLLHPLWGTLFFLVVMFAFFQVIFSVAAPFQDLIERLFAWLSDLVATGIPNETIAGLLGGGVIGGVGAVLVFIPQIVLMFLLISLLEQIGYMARAAFLVDRIMATTGLEGRAFVAMLSSVACAVPGIMATRTLPSSRDRIATTLAAPLMTCSARLPVYILLIGLLVDPGARWGPIGLQGLVMFGLYILGGVAAMTTAWIFRRAVLGGDMLPFYMELPPYRFPSVKTVVVSMWDSAQVFLRKAGTIILATSVVLWFLLNLPPRPGATTAAVLDHSFAASIGRFIQPVFDPLGFDWRICVGLIGAMAAREVFVATMGQIFGLDNPEDPGDAVRTAVWTSGPDQGHLLFTAPTVAALLIFFAFALLCMSTVATIRRETNSWRWPLVAWCYMFTLAWIGAFVARYVTIWVT